ncbi:hypothetical protein CRENBAI_003131 [Crenichthys baileyi]|uniref:Uncharacterized protein n=1 Tax=Crenichthys baileyi TaxID=28760 RepID=A0AAV9SM70_9TELE
MGIPRENVAYISPSHLGVQGPTDTTEGLFFSVRRPERHIRGSASWKVFCARPCPMSAFTAWSRSTKSYDRNEPTHDPVAHSHPSRSPPEQNHKSETCKVDEHSTVGKGRLTRSKRAHPCLRSPLLGPTKPQKHLQPIFNGGHKVKAGGTSNTFV